YDEKLVVTSWYSEDKTEITWDMLKGVDGDPFVKGEAAEFDCFPLGSTKGKRMTKPFVMRFPLFLAHFITRFWRKIKGPEQGGLLSVEYICAVQCQ
ncbi:hypothetical protein AAK917_10015, partial [Oscillospiraceae bacterium 52-8]